jgi:hypothetical protein
VRQDIPDIPDSRSLRLRLQFEAADRTSMDNYSPDTRVELTPKGWLFVAHAALKASARESNHKLSAELRRRANDSVRRALSAIEADEQMRLNQAESNDDSATINQSL